MGANSTSVAKKNYNKSTFWTVGWYRVFPNRLLNRCKKFLPCTTVARTWTPILLGTIWRRDAVCKWCIKISFLTNVVTCLMSWWKCHFFLHLTLYSMEMEMLIPFSVKDYPAMLLKKPLLKYPCNALKTASPEIPSNALGLHLKPTKL